MLEHSNVGWWVRLLRPWRRTISAPAGGGGQLTPEAVLGISDTAITQGDAVSLSAAGSGGANPLEATYRITPPVGAGPTFDLGPYAFTGGTSADVALIPAGIGDFGVRLLMRDTVTGLTGEATGVITVSASALAVGRIDISPSPVSGPEGSNLLLEATVWSEPTAGTLAQKKTALLDYLADLPLATKRLLSGQVSTSNTDFGNLEAIYTQTGKYPAMTDCSLFGSSLAAALTWCGKGGQIVVWANFPDPMAGQPDHDLSRILTGGAQRSAWLATLDSAATQLQQFKDAGYPVLFLPFPLVNADGWYWWNTGDATVADFVAVWQDAHAYLGTTKGLADALVWVYSAHADYHSATADDWYPGSSYVDLTAFSSWTATPGSSDLSAYQQLVALSKPVMFLYGAMTDVTDPPVNTVNNAQLLSDIKNALPNVVGFMLDAGSRGLDQQLGAASVMQDPWTASRDDFGSRPGAGAAVVLLGRVVDWVSDIPSVAAVTTPGQEALLYLLAIGTAHVTASVTEGGNTVSSDPDPVTVLPATVPVDHVDLSTYSISGQEGTTQAVTATPRDAADNALDPSRITGWNTDNADVAFHSSADGLIHLVAPGVAHIRAWGDYAIGSPELTVTVTSSVAVGSVGITPAGPLTVTAGGATTFQARTWSGATPGTGTELFGRAVSWVSSNHTIAADPAAGYNAVANWLAAGDGTIHAVSEGKSSANVSVHADAAPPPSATHQNQGPCSLVKLEWNPTGLPTTFGTNWSAPLLGIVTGTIRRWWNDSGKVTIVDTPGAPVHGKSLRYDWIGCVPGTNPEAYTLWPHIQGEEYPEVYTCWIIRMPDPTFRFHWNGGMKLFGFIGVQRSNLDGEGGSENRMITGAQGGSLVTYAKQGLGLQNGYVYPPVGAYVEGSIGWPTGSWHKLEARYRINSAPGGVPQYDGRARFWVDGVLSMDRNDVNYRTPGYLHQFFSAYWNPTWGGNGGENNPGPTRLDVNHIFVSVATS